MSEDSLNKRAGREDELRKKMKEVIQRYKDVFSSDLTTNVLKDFLVDSRKANKNNFLRDRIGVLSDIDIDYLETILKENVKDSALQDPTDEENALEDLDDLDEEGLRDLD